MSIIERRSENVVGPLALRILGNDTKRTIIRRRIKCVGAAGLLLMACPLFGAGSAPESASVKSSEPSAEDVARLVIEAPSVYEVALAPDGKSVVYSIVRKSVESNLRTAELLLQALDSEGGKLGAPKRLAQQSGRSQPVFRPQWRPDSQAFSYHTTQQETSVGAESSRQSSDAGSSPESAAKPAVLFYDVQSGSTSPFDIRKHFLRQNAPTTTEQTLANVTIGVHTWSSTGRFIAFLNPVGAPAKLDPRKGMVQTPELRWRGARRQALYVLEVASGNLQQLTPDTMTVRQFSWSPDDSELVISASDSQLYEYRDGEDTLRIVNRATGAIRTLVSKPGSHSILSWSPDGKWIAFGDQPQGSSIIGNYFPSVVSVNSPHDVLVLAKDGDPLMAGTSKPSWREDSRAFYYFSPHHMAGEIARADIAERRATTVFPEDTSADMLISFSADSRRVATRHGSLTAPWDLYVTVLPNGVPRAITNFASSFPLRNAAQIERVSWPSQDGKFTVHGLLLLPKTALQPDGSGLKAPLPTVVFNPGGPSMVWSGLDIDGYNGLLLTLAARGYAVLVPNTRARGGYSAAFKGATEDGSAYYKLGYQDMMAGVDMLLKRRVADPQRIGVAGHSYGANLTSYVVTQTDRFKAGVVHEATTLDMVDSVLTLPGSVYATAVAYIFGVSDPLSETSQKRVFDESPRFHLGRMKTPLLLQSGSKGRPGNASEQLYRSMLRMKLPCEYVVYDSGHIVDAPALAVDEMSRVAAWFDYWLRDMPYPDEAKDREFSAWQAAKRSSQQGPPVTR